MAGAMIVRLAFAASIFSVLCYFFAYRKIVPRCAPYGRPLYLLAVAGILAAAGVHIFNIVTHQFQYYYVWNHSSTDLPLPLLISTAYAGQEGSFMLWAFYTGILGVFLSLYAGRKRYEPEFMLVFGSIFSFLLLMLIVKNPFALIWDAFPNELIHTGAVPPNLNFVWLDQAKALWAQVPVEGKGLNPLLQNYWMVIHPQVLFIGFTSMSVPFSYAVAGMLKRDYVSWIRVAAPWTIFGAMILGTGIIMGGYWAYETLGWGGFWGWDPVENSSLVPWLICVASIHTMLSQRRSGAFIKTNFVLSMLCFVMVLYSTFLTRSGVLGDTSVHSFVDAGMWVYWMLLAVIIVYAALGFGLFFMRWKEMPVVPVDHSFFSREFALFLGASALVCISAFVAIGTSAPLITGLLEGKPSAVDPSYYVSTTLPLGIFIALLAGIGQMLWWKKTTAKDVLDNLLLPAVLASLFTIAAIVIGAHHPAMILFIFVSSFALFANILIGYRIMRGNPKLAGGSLAHIGIALMFLGFVSSAKYDEKETISLEQGRRISSMGYAMTYVGYHPTERGRYAFTVEVEREGRKFVVEPVMFQSEEMGGLMRNPDIINLITKDFYLAPVSLEAPQEMNEQVVTMKTNTAAEVQGTKIIYRGYEFSQTAEGNRVTAKIDVIRNGKTVRVQPTMMNKHGEVEYIPAAIPGTNISLVIKGMTPNRQDESKSEMTLGVRTPLDPSQPKKGEVFIVEATVKPFINLVWIGTFALIGGFLITIVRRSMETKNGSSS
ncbi:MAG TPA: cytochrome c biogenesis protein CcsA [Bacteroidota bacterium]|nr:cytochrome c biogenesis protein CcsA [Bacteroidota bacterium]